MTADVSLSIPKVFFGSLRWGRAEGSRLREECGGDLVLVAKRT